MTKLNIADAATPFNIKHGKFRLNLQVENRKQTSALKSRLVNHSPSWPMYTSWSQFCRDHSQPRDLCKSSNSQEISPCEIN